MLDLSQVPTDAPLPLIAVAVLYNLVRHALNLHHERKQAKGDEDTQRKILELSTALAEAKAEIKYLRERMDEKGA